MNVCRVDGVMPAIGDTGLCRVHGGAKPKPFVCPNCGVDRAEWDRMNAAMNRLWPRKSTTPHPHH